MATEVKTESNSASSDYHTPRPVEDVTERNVQTILQWTRRLEPIAPMPKPEP
jgi:hypothetical protein